MEMPQLFSKFNGSSLSEIENHFKGIPLSQIIHLHVSSLLQQYWQPSKEWITACTIQKFGNIFWPKTVEKEEFFGYFVQDW